MNKDKSLILKFGREKSVLNYHPWIFSGAIENIVGIPDQGETVRVLDTKKNFLAWAAYSKKSQISARIWTWDEDQAVNNDFIINKIDAAKKLRECYFPTQMTDSYRLFFSESDGIPGLIIDKYGDFLIYQISSTGAEFWRDAIFEACIKLGISETFYERSDAEVRRLEGLPQKIGLLRGKEPPDLIEIHENEIRFLVNIKTGQKTGFYLDQRENRRKLIAYSKNKRVLNCFCYTGGFSLNSIKGGAKEVSSIDSSGSALILANDNMRLNQFNTEPHYWIEGDVFKELRLLRDRGEKYDLIVLDPPKFAPTVHSIERANRAYKDINLLAFKLLNPGGVLFTFSCSGGINSDLFRKIVHGAAVDAGVNALILEQLHQDRDHPIPLHFPEAEYLKGLVCQIQ
jgi:23S rRNA (cytosine1962-C5)-methyltransferase